MMERRLAGYLRRCDWVLGSDAEDMANVKKILPQGRFSVLRRGIDKDTFHTGKHDRQKLHDAFDIPEDRFVLLCVGRLDPDKSVLTLARAARALLDQGAPVHVIFAGDGTQKDELRRMLGDRASLPGSLPQADLGWLYASADLFVFPSPHEISPNVVLEAKASGLPVVVSAEGGSAQFVEKFGEDGLVLDTQNPAAWAEAIEFLRLHPERRAAMGENGLRWIETHWPSWQSVLEEDLLPVWQRVARERSLWQPAL
jgi:glycosyltransferase involved in cell wall biosynthesis